MMERRELYEPEDIEQLLMERAYDDLLEEERAFVLRHLNGRQEYESMRKLLLNVDEDDRAAHVLDADPSVRDHVLGVFRAQQQPQWRIWLNSVQVFLLPREVSGFWRPALALGSVALLVMFVVNGSRQLHEAAAPEMAEVKQKPNDHTPEKPAVQLDPQFAPSTGITETGDGTAALKTEQREGGNKDQMDRQNQRAKDQTSGLAAAAGEAPPAALRDDIAEAIPEEKNETTPAPAMKGIIVMDASTDTFRTVDKLVSHEVTAKEFAMNVTTAGTTESISAANARRFAKKAKAEDERARKRGLFDQDDNALAEATADVAPLLDLLRAAW